MSLKAKTSNKNTLNDNKFEKKLCSIYTALNHQYHTYSAITQPIITSFTQHYLSLSMPTQIIIPQHAVTSKNESGILRSSPLISRPLVDAIFVTVHVRDDASAASAWVVAHNRNKKF